MSNLAFGISTTGYLEFEKRNNIYDVSEIFCLTFTKWVAILERNWEILKIYFQSDESSTQTVRNLCEKFGRKEMPSTQFVDQFVKRIRQTGSLLDKATRSVRSTENIAALA